MIINTGRQTQQRFGFNENVNGVCHPSIHPLIHPSIHPLSTLKQISQISQLTHQLNINIYITVNQISYFRFSINPSLLHASTCHRIPLISKDLRKVHFILGRYSDAPVETVATRQVQHRYLAQSYLWSPVGQQRPLVLLMKYHSYGQRQER